MTANGMKVRSMGKVTSPHRSKTSLALGRMETSPASLLNDIPFLFIPLIMATIE